MINCFLVVSNVSSSHLELTTDSKSLAFQSTSNYNDCIRPCVRNCNYLKRIPTDSCRCIETVSNSGDNLQQTSEKCDYSTPQADSNDEYDYPTLQAIINDECDYLTLQTVNNDDCDYRTLQAVNNDDCDYSTLQTGYNSSCDYLTLKAVNNYDCDRPILQAINNDGNKLNVNVKIYDGIRMIVIIHKKHLKRMAIYN